MRVEASLACDDGKGYPLVNLLAWTARGLRAARRGSVNHPYKETGDMHGNEYNNEESTWINDHIRAKRASAGGEKWKGGE